MCALRPCALLGLCCLLIACDDDGGASTGPGAAPDTGSMTDARPADARLDLDALPPDALTDAGPPDARVCPEPPQCDEDERQVGCRCVHRFDRVCETQADCRPEEECREVEGFRLCWFEPPPVQVCPGAEGCAAGEGVLRAAAVSKIFTPQGFETPEPQGLEDDNGINFNPGDDLDGLWRDCGYDGLCPGDADYSGPDEGEADGVMQGMWLAGFSVGRPAQFCPDERVGCEGVDCCVSKYAHDDLKIQIAVLEQGETTVALATIDTVGFLRPQSQAILQALPAELGVDLLIMAATHNHEAPDTAGQWGPGTSLPLAKGTDPRLMQRIHDLTVEGITEAVAALQPTRVEAMVLNVGVEGLAMADSRAPWIIDDNVPVVRLTATEGGAPIATLLSFANHAEVLWDDNPYITADYPHYARQFIREGVAAVTEDEVEIKPALPGFGGVTLMFAGAVGGLIYPGRGGALDYAGRSDFDDHSFAAARAVGETLAARVLGAAAAGRLSEVPSPELRFATRTFLADVDNRVFQTAAYSLGVLEHDVYNVTRRGAQYVPSTPKVLTQAAVVRLGSISFFSAPGEVFPETLVGGFPGRARVQTPVVGDVEERSLQAVCDADGLPVTPAGDQPCIIRAGAENPPDWSMTPPGPYLYERVPGEHPFFIGLGMDFLGYMVPLYDYEEAGYLRQPPGDHYEETNGVGVNINQAWERVIDECVEALR